MTFHSDTLLEQLAALSVADRPPVRYLVAFSGGLDSTVLLHALAAARSKIPVPIVALHVNHGLHADADTWEVDCSEFAKSVDVEFLSCRIEVAADTGLGPEAAARQARYAALRGWVGRDDYLLSAHHEDDQAETLLLNLLRGSGVSGLSGIGERQTFADGFLLRPLLGIAGQALREYAAAHQLIWVDDPSNAESRFDRNFLRNEIFPQLASRWPAASSRLRRSADLVTEVATMLDDLAQLDMRNAGSASRLEIAALQSLPEPRQRNLLRYAIRSCGLPPAPATRIYQVLRELLTARPDAQPLVHWSGAEIRRYRGHIYLLTEMTADPGVAETLLTANGGGLDLGPGCGSLRLERGTEFGIDPALAAAGLRLRYRKGGETIRPRRRGSTLKLRNLLQEAAIVPWMRERIPLLYAGEELVAIADLWLADEHATAGGYAVCWDERPDLH